MDRLGQLRGEAGGSRDSTLDTTSPPSESFMTANESTSKYFTLSEEDSTFDISSIKDVSLASTTTEPDPTITSDDELISNLSPIGKKSEMLDSYKIGKQIEAANILSGGVDIFEDNDNSYDGDELVIDDNVDLDEKSNSEVKLMESDNNSTEPTLSEEDVPSKDTEVVLQIDGKNVDAIDIGNGLYLYRKQGQEELAAVQIIDDDQHQPSFKFLKVRENAEGNLEVYEEIEIEVPKEVPVKEGKMADKNTMHVPIKDINKVISDSTCNKVVERNNKMPQNEMATTSSTTDLESDINNDATENKSEVNLNGKMMKFNESRKSPVIGSFKPMTYHSTPNKEGKPLTKTMVDLHLHPSRHSDNVKKTIEVHTDSSKPRIVEPNTKSKDQDEKVNDTSFTEKDKDEKVNDTSCTEINQDIIPKEKDSIEKLVTKEDKNEDNIKEIDTLIENQIKQDKLPLDVDEKKMLSEETRFDNKQTTPMDNIDMQPKQNMNDSLKTSLENILKPEMLKEANENETKKMNVVPEIITKTKEYGPDKDVSQVSIVTSTESISVDSAVKEFSPENIGVEEPKEDILRETSEIVTSNVELIDVVLPEKKVAEKHSHQKDKQEKEIVSLECSKKIEPVTSSISNDLPLDKKENKETLNLNPDNPLIDKTVEAETSKKPIQLNQPSSDHKGKADGRESKTLEVSNKKERICEKVQIKEQKSESNVEEVSQEKKEVKLIQSIPQMEQIILKEKPIVAPKEILSVKKVNFEKIASKLMPNIEPSKSNYDNDCNIVKKCAASTSDMKVVQQQIVAKEYKKESDDKKGPAKASTIPLPKPINNNHAPVPFGKWTEANRQDFLNKIKETKVPVHSSNGKQIKNSNDLNRRDVLKKIDSQRQSNNTAKAQELIKLNIKNEVTFASKSSTIKTQETKIPSKIESIEVKNKPTLNKKVTKQEPTPKSQVPPTVTSTTVDTVTKKETAGQRKEMSTAQDLIDKTIEGMIHRTFTTKNVQEETKQNIGKDLTSKPATTDRPTTLDAIEMKMNELHGIPFIERPPHELPQAFKPDLKISKTEKETTNKLIKEPNLVPSANKVEQKHLSDNIVEIDSEEEVIEHEPITGDIDLKKKNVTTKLLVPENNTPAKNETIVDSEASKKESIITETDFDKFARRNSITYENCLTVNFDSKEPHNVIQTVIEKDIAPKNYSRNDKLRNDAKATLPQKQQCLRQNIIPSKVHTVTKYTPRNEEVCNKSYQTKVQLAYQSLTAKHQKSGPITIIEDKPVKVVFMESNSEFVPSKLNVHGQELSPKKLIEDSDAFTVSTNDSIDSDILDVVDSMKVPDESKTKTKHQRKQVLTPVETPELELIEPSDLGIEVSPKKKRKTDEYKSDKSVKNLIHKKSYLLGRSTTEGKPNNSQDIVKNPLKETVNRKETISDHKDTATAIDSLVKAAELIEHQSENVNSSNTSLSDSQLNTPVKRGRGRPRKYPLPEGTVEINKNPSPQKKPRLIDAKMSKPEKEYNTETSDEEVNSDGEIIKENWTMGKINENIVCPICKKLFRSENVVFKHVKHCTGPSPNRSDSDKRSPRRGRQSQESDNKSFLSKSDEMEIDEEKHLNKKDTPKKRKSKDSKKSDTDKDDVIIIEDTPVKEIPEKSNKVKQHDSRKMSKIKPQDSINKTIVCEFCGKKFRQISHLERHMLQQHKKDEPKRTETDNPETNKSVLSCDVCKKEFRKLHHLVQHRIIHNPNATSSRLPRKSSSEQNDYKNTKEQDTSKQNEDQSAGFRCEPCDKSFRKLHHLVEHRETHDGINRQKNATTTTTVQANIEKSAPAPQCEICKKTFRKLHHLVEHKEQHVETSSEKSDDKSIKSSLSTKDIIHECSLCYMVFPNEHSLTKHTVICQRKKRQSKQPKPNQDQNECTDDKNLEEPPEELKMEDDEPELIIEAQITDADCKNDKLKEPPHIMAKETPLIIAKETPLIVANESPLIIAKETPLIIAKETVIETPILEKVFKKKEDTPLEIETVSLKKDKNEESKNLIPKSIQSTQPEVARGVIEKKEVVEDEVIHIQDYPKKKTPAKDKLGPSVSKRQKISNVPIPKVNAVKPSVESSDDDEVRYMFNPDFEVGDTNEGKIFMNVRAKKRNSLQIERPNSKDLVKRRISLQHPPKIPRLKAKPIETKVLSTASKNVNKAIKLESVPSTDSDDSDVKYSFPKTASEKDPKPEDNLIKRVVRKTPRKSLAEKRKSLSSIAKRKSLGKPVIARHKATPTPTKQIKRRTTQVEHRCDCGQLFSSAALLSRHTSLAHTPPRIRRRRSPPPDIDTKTVVKPAPRKSSVADKTKQADSRKSSVRSDTSNSNANTKPTTALRKSNVVKTEVKTPNKRKSIKSADKSGIESSNVKPRRNAAHKGVPVPEKMRKLMEKSKK